MNSAKLDAWITGNYGEDHPDNQEHEMAREYERVASAWRQAEAYERWLEWRGRVTEPENTEREE